MDNQHSMGPINQIMEVVYTTTKGKQMDTIENYHIYKETHNNNQINDRDTVKHNPIFETLVHRTKQRGQPNTVKDQKWKND
jgi:hypothetical protein